MAMKQHNNFQLFTFHFFYVRETSVSFKLLLFGVFACLQMILILINWRIQFISEFLFYKVISWDIQLYHLSKVNGKKYHYEKC